MSKKNITKMFLLVTLIILLTTVVSAAEISNNTDTSTTDTTNNIKSVDTTYNVDTIDKSVTTKNTKQNLKDSTKTYDVNDFNTLHNALTNNSYDTVNVNIKSDITLENTTDVNEAIKTLNINGNNKTINGNNTHQFLKINSGTVIINNIKIINCFTDDEGGAIYNKAKLTIINTTLNNNIAHSGGSIYNFGKTTIVNSLLNNNKVAYDYNEDVGYGGAIYNEANLNIINCTLNSNSHHSIDGFYLGEGGAIYNTGNLTITNSTLNKNFAENGGAISNNAKLNIINCTLNNNYVNSYGGAIENIGNLNITNSTLNNNNAYLDCGAIKNIGNLNITNSILNNNTALFGGAISNNAKLNIINCTLNNNDCGYDGGAIENSGNLTIINSTLNNNKANDYGGAIENSGNLTITNSTLNNNKAYYYGGAIYNRGNLNITSSVLNSNVATPDEYVMITGHIGYGGAIYNRGNNTIIENNIFISNKANTTGKAIMNHGKATISNNTNAETSKYNATIYTNGTNVKIKNNIFYDDMNVFINSMNILNNKYVLTTKVTDENYTKLNSGRVSYTLNGKWIGSINVKDGSSWISFNVPTTGNHTLIANYIDKNGIQLGSDTFTFEKIANINVLFNSYDIKNDKVIIVSTVKDDKGNNITNGRLSYTINYKWIGSINIKNGNSWISFNNTNNTIKFKATYITDNNVTQTSYTKILNLNQLNNFINKPEDKTLKNSSIHIMINSINVLNNKYVLTTKITDNNYTKLNAGRVSYTLNGKWIGSINVTNGTSWISFDVAGLGNHTIIATYIDTNGKAITTDTYSFEKKDNVNAVFNAYDDKNGKIIIVTTVKNDKSNPINSGRISYNVNNKWIGSINVKNGSSWISFNNTNTTITFKATYITDDNIKQNIYTRTLNLNEIARLKKA